MQRGSETYQNPRDFSDLCHHIGCGDAGVEVELSRLDCLKRD